jgi:hypothetical protein
LNLRLVQGAKRHDVGPDLWRNEKSIAH